jgi:uncharacterized alkaline shock family protein YloU
MAKASTAKKKGHDDNITLEEVASGDGTVGGQLKMSEDVVATIAGLAAREIDGIASMGGSRFISLGDSPTRGVEAEVGNVEAALDLDVVIEYGADIHKMAGELRSKIAETVYRMAGRKVKEVNINVVGIEMPKQPEPPKEEEPARVK